MNSQSRFSSRPIGFEMLESRQMMAANPFGNVQVHVVNGSLVVSGDNLQSDLQIVQTMVGGAPVAGSYFVAPRNGTTINGQGTGQYFENVTRDMRINLSGGNDRLLLGNGSSDANFIVPNDLKIDMGAGADVVTVDRISVGDDASIVTGDGNDNVTFKGSVGAAGIIEKGANDLTIDTGARPDTVVLQDTYVRRNLSVNTGKDNFADVVDLYFTTVGNNSSVFTGEGGDVVDIADTVFNKNLTVNTGGGSDTVSLNRCQVDQFFADLGLGTDQLRLKDSSGRRATLNGGGNADTLLRTNSPFSQLFQATSF